MSSMKTSQSRFATEGPDDPQPIKSIDMLPGTTFSPSVGLILVLEDGSTCSIEMHVDEAFAVALEILTTIRRSEDKYENNSGAAGARNATTKVFDGSNTLGQPI